MLLATPFLHIEKVLPKDGPPRIISEIKKTQIGLSKELNRPRLSGDLLVKCGGEQQWWPRRASIRGGQLLVGSVHGESKYGSIKIPLRRLSLSAGKLPNSLSLIRGQNIILTVQASSERTFDLWVKAIAIELIRQTPLEDVKYFDILTIDDSWKQKLNEKQKDWNFNHLTDAIVQPERCSSCSAISNRVTEATKKDYGSLAKYETYPISTKESPLRNKRCGSSLKNVTYSSQRSQIYQRTTEKISSRARSRSCNSVPKEDAGQPDINSNYIEKPQITVTFDKSGEKADNEEKAIEVLLKKCQNPESYVPVKEKLLLFETLCRLGRKVKSTEDAYLKVDIGTKRARSLHDLHSVSSAGVRQICRYFENKCESQVCEKFEGGRKDARLINSDSNLSSMQRVRCIRTMHNVSHA